MKIPSDNKFQETTAVRDKIEGLRSRIAFLEKIFEKPADDGAERMRRNELLMCVIGIGPQLP